MKNVGTARASPNAPEKPNTATVPRAAPGLTAHPWSYRLSNSFKTEHLKQIKEQGSLFHFMKKQDPQHLKPLEECGTQTNFGSLTFMIFFFIPKH